MKYLKKFETEAQYTAAESNLILPNVSLVTENNTVHYNPFVDPYGGHDYVEIGGLKWAAMNIGATAVTDTGLYFAWGDTQGYTAAQVGSGEGKKYFDWADYKYWTSNTGSGSSGFTKYNSTDGKTVLDSSDDAVTAAWGGSWRMPTKEDFAALSVAVNTEWVTDYQGSGVNGRLMTDKTDTSKKLFFPAAGGCFNGSVNEVGNGLYWSSSLYPNKARAYRLVFHSDNMIWQDGGNRRAGFLVRGVVGQ